MKTLFTALSCLLLLGSKVQNVKGCASDAECVCNSNGQCAESVDESIVAFPEDQCRTNRDEQCICSSGQCQLLCMDFEALTAEQIIEDVLKDSNGFIEVRNITSSQHACFDFFTNGHVMGNSIDPNNPGPLLPDQGVIMGTGKPRDFCWDDSRTTNHQFNTPGDAELETITGEGMTDDACFIELEFRCTGEFPQISFNYVWGSDEYSENIGGEVDDAFAFFLDDVNMAVLPDGATPVTIDNVNPSRNSEFYINNREESLYPIIEADGFTTMLQATGIINDGGWKTLKMVIADVGDAEVDSYVLVAANSLTCVDPSASFTPSVSPSLAPSVSSAPSVSQKPSLSTKPSASAAPSVSARPSVSTAPSTSQEPSASSQPSMSAAPSISANPSVSQKPSVSAQPSVTAAPSISVNPTDSQAPSVSSQPSVSASPSVSSNPSVTAWPSVSAQPTVSSAPSVSTKPSVSSAPSVSHKPSVSSAPSISAAPSVSSNPSVTAWPSVSAHPTVSSAPSVSTEPSVSSAPSVSHKPSVSSAPSISAAPSVSSNPSVTAWPSVSAHPTVSSAPSISTAPSVSSNPSVTAWPSVSAQPTVSSAPSVSTEPSVSSAPSVSHKPSVSSAPSVSSNPSFTAWPSVSAHPTVSSAPSISAAPSVSSNPSFTAWPSVSAQPTVSSAPSISAAPSVSSNPSFTAWPSVSAHPTVSSAPSASTAPSVSSQPSISANPSVTGRPTVSSKPSVSIRPSVSVEPSASQEPSVSAQPSVSAAPSVTTNPSLSSAPSITVSQVPSVSAQPSVSANPSASLAPSVTAAPSTSSAPTIHTPGIINGTIFNDLNQDGVRDENENGLPNIAIALWCARNGHPAARVDSTTTDSNGVYMFAVNPPGTCFIEVETPGFLFSPRVEGGNQLGPNGRSPDVYVKYRDVIEINGGITLPVPGIINGTIFDDLNRDGVRDENENGLPNIVIALWCARNGNPAAKVDTDTTGPSGVYMFSVDPPGTCFIRVETPGFLFSPRVEGGNQIGPDGRSPDVFVNYRDVIEINGGITLPVPGIIEGMMFNDLNQDGVRDPVTENGIPNIVIALWCARNGLPTAKVDMDTTDSLGVYKFIVDTPGRCFIRVETPGYLYGPKVEGGNQLGPDGRSPEVDVSFMDVININGGLYLPFEATCVEHCNERDEIEDCGWGIWNTCTCQCDCDPGFCLSANQKCYDGCTTHLDFNPFGGCRPGLDCPWYPDNLGAAHCTSSQNFAGIYNLHETAEKCCEEHFSSQNVNACAQNSVADVEAQEQLTQDRLDRPRFYWPDLHGKENCVFDSGYDDFMEMEGQREQYLFDTDVGCCGLWYPNKSNCPEVTSATTPFQLDYNPDVSLQFYYPHLSESVCRFGRNYPMWMKNSPRHYLYTTPEECCNEWYPDTPNCVQAEDDGVQEGFYWIVDEAFYPNFNGDWCAQGNSYPEWMADPTERETHLFKTGQECCDLWFPDETAECQSNIVTVIDGRQIAGPDVTGTWYPSLNGLFQCINGTPPKWMTSSEGYEMAYVFDSRSECCKAHWCDAQRDQTPPF